MDDDAARAELARLQGAEAARKKRNKVVGGVLAGAVLLGGGVVVGIQLAGGGSEAEGDPVAAESSPGPNESQNAPVAENPGTSPTDIDTPSPEDNPNESIDNQENPDFIDLSTAEKREDASAEEILNFYSGLEKRWVEGTGDDAGVTYVSDFLVARGATTPVIGNADEIIQEPGLSLKYTAGEEGEAPIHTAAPMNENLAASLNTYLANKDELGLDINGVDPVNRYFFNGVGKRVVRGLNETLDNPNLCLDQYDCLRAYENSDFRQIFNEVDTLPEGAAITRVTVNPSSSGRYSKQITLAYTSSDQESAASMYIELEEGLTLYPMQFDASYLETSSTRAASLNQVYRGMPYGESAEAYLYLSNDEQIQDKIGNPNLQ